jgi:hypothetical protein
MSRFWDMGIRAQARTAFLSSRINFIPNRKKGLLKLKRVLEEVRFA